MSLKRNFGLKGVLTNQTESALPFFLAGVRCLDSLKKERRLKILTVYTESEFSPSWVFHVKFTQANSL